MINDFKELITSPQHDSDKTFLFWPSNKWISSKISVSLMEKSRYCKITITSINQIMNYEITFTGHVNKKKDLEGFYRLLKLLKSKKQFEESILFDMIKQTSNNGVIWNNTFKINVTSLMFLIDSLQQPTNPEDQYNKIINLHSTIKISSSEYKVYKDIYMSYQNNKITFSIDSLTIGQHNCHILTNTIPKIYEKLEMYLIKTSIEKVVK